MAEILFMMLIPLVRYMQLYIPWNYHERFPGEYTWDGMADVFSFIELIQELDMLVLLRVGPYICAEWDFGGLPWWLGSSQVTIQTLSTLSSKSSH